MMLLVLLVFLMLQVSMICNRIYLHCFLAHRAIVTLHPVVATAMHLWLSILTGIDPKKWAWKHRDHHNYKKTDPYNPLEKGQWHVFFMTWFYYAKGKPGPKDALDYKPDWVDRIPFIGYRGVSGLLILAAVGAVATGSPSGLWLGAAVWLSHIFCFALLFSALNAFAHEAGRPQEGNDSRAINVWWLFPLTWGENFHKNHHARADVARFAKFDPAWPIIRVLDVCGFAESRPAIGEDLAPRFTPSLRLLQRPNAGIPQRLERSRQK